MVKEQVLETMESRADAINALLYEEGADFEVQYTKLWKNNHEVEGYVLRSEAHNCSPTIYRGSWFEGTDDEVVAYLTEMYEKHATDFDIKEAVSRDFILANVLPRLMSASNEAGLRSRQVVVRPYLDMVVSFYVPISEFSDDGIGSMQITEMLLKNANIGIDEIHEKAISNLEKGIKIQRIDEVIREIIGNDIPLEDEPGIPMYVVTNSNNIHGAAVILSKKTFEGLHERLGDKVAILPSSIHECIAVAYRTPDDLDNFISMVKEINATEVNVSDKLTDNVYLLNGDVLSALE